MPLTDELQYPVLEITLNGAVVERRPVSFRLITFQGQPSVISQLFYPADVESGRAGDKIEIRLVSGMERVLYFTGEVCDAHVRGAHRELLLTDSYKKLLAPFTPAYRKEKAKIILGDILDKAGITKQKIACPDIEIARFSTNTCGMNIVLNLLIDALTSYGFSGLRYFFDAEDTFRFGTIADSAKNEGAVPRFESGKNIIRKGQSWAQTLPVPLRHSQDVTVDGTAFVTYITDLDISQRRSRFRFWLTGEQ